MNWKALSIAVYAITVFALAAFFDALYGAGPVVRYLWLVRFAIAGAGILGLACILSLVTVRGGAVCGLIGGAITLPYFGLLATGVPWGHLVSVLPYANWRYIVTAVVAVLLSTAYSVFCISRLHRSRPST